MKKIIFVSALAVLGFTSQAQVTFGIKAGANIANWTGSDADDAKSLVGFNGGGQVHIPVGSMFSVNPELVLSMEGTKFDAGGEDVKYKTTYVNVPVLFQYNSSGFFAHTGPQIGFLVAAKAEAGDESEDIKELLNSTNFSWVIGLGYKLANGLGFNARYNLGLSKLIKDSDDTDIKGSAFQVGAFFNFGGAGASSND